MAKSTTPTISKVRINGVDWTPDLIKQKILTSDQAVKNALLRVYSWQTQEEQSSERTIVANSMGFNGVDSVILSSFAEQLTKKGWLSQKQLAIARKRLVKYSRQIFTNHIAQHRQEVYSKFGV